MSDYRELCERRGDAGRRFRLLAREEDRLRARIVVRQRIEKVFVKSRSTVYDRGRRRSGCDGVGEGPRVVRG